MSKILRISVLTIITTIAFLLMPAISNAYTVKSGDSMWKIAQQNSVSVLSLQNANNRSNSIIYPGENLLIPEAISASDKQLMAKLVHAEAKGEPYAGKVAVATVILNRVDHKDFPDSVAGVIYETYNNGLFYAFSPVKDGAINQPADAESISAVNEAIAFRGQGQGSIFFYNPETAVNKWISSRQITIKIGNHVFAK
ncbi:cell wall hydrolase [Gracilibacillus xinjiangensis]|uniref:Cell wall hydrolase n=1 Tax=Gracilibacillus xinjiangensis TaxID=1193282 RepID=A0ABV8WVH6_9BACI